MLVSFLPAAPQRVTGNRAPSQCLVPPHAILGHLLFWKNLSLVQLSEPRGKAGPPPFFKIIIFSPCSGTVFYRKKVGEEKKRPSFRDHSHFFVCVTRVYFESFTLRGQDSLWEIWSFFTSTSNEAITHTCNFKVKVNFFPCVKHEIVH